MRPSNPILVGILAFSSSGFCKKVLPRSIERPANLRIQERNFLDFVRPFPRPLPRNVKHEFHFEYNSTAFSSIQSLLDLKGGSISSITHAVSSTRTRCWFLLLSAILVDTMATALMKVAQQESKIYKLALSYLLYFMSLSFFALSLRLLDISVAYAVWGALGTAIVSVYGILIFNEGCDATKLACLAMIVLGVVGLNLREQH